MSCFSSCLRFTVMLESMWLAKFLLAFHTYAPPGHSVCLGSTREYYTRRLGQAASTDKPEYGPQSSRDSHGCNAQTVAERISHLRTKNLLTLCSKLFGSCF
ncbi:hypothetical protein B0H34DRAFT_738278 [Crassisporium funariophilum]|nr:hypothetical protein B0H34DRAFT_738278 [Crassisporium funariophilum]